MPLLHSGIDEIYSMFLDPDGTAWATGADYILHRWERGIAGDPDAGVEVLTRRIQIIGNPEDWYGGAGPFNETKLPWRENALRFEFAAPFYEEPSAMEYQVRLEGSDSDWSRWSHETKRDYTHLPEGSYRFRVRARTPHGAVSENAAAVIRRPAALVQDLVGIRPLPGVWRLRCLGHCSNCARDNSSRTSAGSRRLSRSERLRSGSSGTRFTRRNARVIHCC